RTRCAGATSGLPSGPWRVRRPSASTGSRLEARTPAPGSRPPPAWPTGSPRARPSPSCALAKDDHHEVRAQAVVALGAVGDAHAQGAVLALLAEPRAQVQLRVLRCLGRLGGPAGWAFALAHLRAVAGTPLLTQEVRGAAHSLLPKEGK